jgi:ATP-dependent RNA helicase MRH4
MVLSDHVARPDRPSSDGRPDRKKREPFSYLNRTKTSSIPPEKGEKRSGTGFSESRRHDTRSRSDRQEPFHALKMQKTLHEIPYGNRSAIKKRIEEVDSFEGLPLMESVQNAIKDALPELEYRTPTPAQAVAIPALLGLTKQTRTRNPSTKSGLESFLLAAETGSGKTLAYLLPIIDAIKREETRDAETAARKEQEEAETKSAEQRHDPFAVESPEVNKAVDPARPRAIILVPSAELVAQVGAVAKSLSHTVKFRAAPISAKMSATVIRNRLFNENGVDVVISTPPLLASIAESNPNILARVTHLVADEADSLLDRSFKPSTMEIIDRATPSLKKLILCSATIPKYLDKYLADKFPDMNRLVTPNLHAIPRRVALGVIDVNKDPYRGNKLLACADTIWKIGRASGDYDPAEGKEVVPTKQILVFVNERDDTEEVARYLQKKGIDAMAFHRDTDPSRQARALASFTGTEKAAKPPKEGEEAAAVSESKPAGNERTLTNTKVPAGGNERILTNTKVMVTTDLGSRGIDTVSVRHVILYDVPHTTIDFIHRLGRTGRMGRRGRGVVLVGPGDRADVVREVRDAMFRGEALI